MGVLSTLTEYTLPNVNSPAGEFTVKVYCSDASLTVPSIQTILTIGSLEEGIDVAPSIQEASTLNISIADDTSTHAQGFWYKALASECHIKFMLMESSAETYFFFGTVEPLQVSWTDHYVNTGSTVFVRSADITLVSFEKKLFDGTTIDLQNDVYSRRVVQSSDSPQEGDPYTYFRVMNIFASLLYITGLNETYDRTDVEYIYNPSLPDFKYIQAGTLTPFTFENLFLFPSIWLSGGELASYFFTGTSQWSQKYHYLKDFISMLLNTFQLILKFDFTDDRVKIKLYQRGHAYSDALMASIGHPINRTITIASDKQIDSVSAHDYWSPSNLRWVARQYSDDVQSIAVPDYISIYLEIPVLFQVGVGSFSSWSISAAQVLAGASGINEDNDDTMDQTFATRITSTEWYNYNTNAYVAPSISDLYRLEESIAGYIYNRFAGSFKAIQATYGTIKSTINSVLSQANSRAMIRQSINDGNGAVSYYAQSVKKDPSTNRMTIIWLEE